MSFIGLVSFSKSRMCELTKEDLIFAETLGIHKDEYIKGLCEWYALPGSGKKKHIPRTKKERNLMERAKRYNITVEELNELLDLKTCEVCGGISERMHIDHNHETGKVRGLLCPGCNLGLGLLKEDPERIRALANYIEERN